MTRNRRKKALYEVIGKSEQKQALENLHPAAQNEERPNDETYPQVSQRFSQWPRGPKSIQFNAGRVELSVRYEIAIAVVLGLVLLVLVAVRLGHNFGARKAVVPTDSTLLKMKETVSGPIEGQRQPEKLIMAEKTAEVPAGGDHRIVLTQFRRERDLEAAQRYFAANNIETVIQKRGTSYFLVTKGTFENPQRSGTDGYSMVQRIKEAGAKYKAPSGYESFAPNLFRDAYGEKIK